MLDESRDAAGEHSLHRFLADNFSSLPGNFRVLITSRPEHGIKSAFLKAESTMIKYMNDPELASQTQPDILTFLKKRLSSHDLDKYGDALAKRAEGLFQWAAVACGYILEPKLAHSRKGRIKQLLSSAPSGQDQLTELYKGVLEEYFSDKEAQGLFRSVLGQLLAAFKPLCQDLAGSWYAQCERVNCGCKGSVVQWFCGSEESIVAQERQKLRGNYLDCK